MLERLDKVIAVRPPDFEYDLKSKGSEDLISLDPWKKGILNALILTESIEEFLVTTISYFIEVTAFRENKQINVFEVGKAAKRLYGKLANSVKNIVDHRKESTQRQGKGFKQ